MKFFVILSFVSLVFILSLAEIVSKAQESNKQNAVNMNEIFSEQGKKGDIEYRITGRLQKKGTFGAVTYPTENIIINYELKNTGAKSYVVYDRGHSNDSGTFAYVEPTADGAIELSLKAFSEPVGKNCPARFVAVVPRGTLLKSGEVITEKVYVEMPLTAKTPFDDCEPQAQLAANASRVKFCIGFQEIADEKLKIDQKSRISPLPDLKNQKFICTELGEIK